jgi:ParB family chromosome partitioning protein
MSHSAAQSNRSTETDRPLDAVSMKRHIATVPIDDVGPSPLQPRQHVVESDRTELMQSIKVHGIIEPLVVRERPVDQLAGGRYVSRLELVAGEQRWTAAKRAGVTEVDVVIRELTDSHVIEFGLVENLRRTDLHPMDEAAAYERLLSMNPAYTDDALADRVGKDVSTIRKRRKLLRLIPDCREAFLHGAITVKHAEKLSTIPAGQQLFALRACFSDLLMFHGDEGIQQLWEQVADEFAATPDANNSTVAMLIHAKAWDKLSIAQKPVVDLSQWMETHTTADLHDAEVQAALQLEPALPTADMAPGEVPLEDPTASLLKLSESQDYAFTGRDAKALGVVPRSRWHEIDSPTDVCDFAAQGVVVHGGALRLVEQVCASKKCHKHFPPPAKRSSEESEYQKTPADERRERAEEKARAEQVEWEQQRERVYPAFAAHVAKMKITPDLVAAAINQDAQDITETYGVKLKAETLGQFMACAALGTYHYYRGRFESDAKKFGFDLKAYLAKEKAATAAKAAPATKPGTVAKKKPAKAKKGR